MPNKKTNVALTKDELSTLIMLVENYERQCKRDGYTGFQDDCAFLLSLLRPALAKANSMDDSNKADDYDEIFSVLEEYTKAVTDYAFKGSMEGERKLEVVEEYNRAQKKMEELLRNRSLRTL